MEEVLERAMLSGSSAFKLLPETARVMSTMCKLPNVQNLRVADPESAEVNFNCRPLVL